MQDDILDRRGIIAVSGDMMAGPYFKEVIELFYLLQFMPLQSIPDYMRKRISYSGVCPSFEIVPEGNVCPEYTIIVERDEAGIKELRLSPSYKEEVYTNIGNAITAYQRKE